MSEHPFNTRKSLQDLFAGTCAGITSVVVCYPLDTVRTRLQTTTSGQFGGVLDCFSKTVRNEGGRALYKGMAAPLASQAVQKSILFATFGATKRWFTSDSGRALGLSEVFVCGALSGLANTVVATPVELVRNSFEMVISLFLTLQPTLARLMTQYQLPPGQKPLYAGPVDCIRQVYQSAGLRGLYRGMWPTMLRDVPGVGMWYMMFELSKGALTREGLSIHPVLLPVAGAIGGVGYWVTAYPQDSIKSILQTDTHGKYRGFSHVATSLIREGGPLRLYRGFSTGLVRGIPGAATTFTTFTMVMRLFPT